MRIKASTDGPLRVEGESGVERACIKYRFACAAQPLASTWRGDLALATWESEGGSLREST